MIGRFIDQHFERVAYMAIFATAFTVIGYFVPKIYLTYLDKTEHVQIRQPVSTEFQEYKRGEKIGLVLNRKSLINVTVRQSAKIVHINGAMVTTQLGGNDSPKEITMNKSADYEVVQTNSLFVPCDAAPGRNFMQIVFTYSVDGVEKTYTYVSQVFQVLDDKMDRCD